MITGHWLNNFSFLLYIWISICNIHTVIILLLSKHCQTCKHLCSHYVPSRSTQGNYVIIQSFGTTNKAGIRNAQDTEYTGVFNIAVYGEIIGTKIFGRIRQESVIHKIRNKQIILYNKMSTDICQSKLFSPKL